MSTATSTAALRYRFLGTTDDVLQCAHCGRSDLALTVILEILDEDGNVDDVTYFGTTCAARAISGRIGTKVTAADVKKGLRAEFAAQVAAYSAWADAWQVVSTEVGDAILAEQGAARSFETYCRYLVGNPRVAAAREAFIAEHGEQPAWPSWRLA